LAAPSPDEVVALPEVGGPVGVGLPETVDVVDDGVLEPQAANRSTIGTIRRTRNRRTRADYS
jgi:hypothetical protein